MVSFCVHGDEQDYMRCWTVLDSLNVYTLRFSGRILCSVEFLTLLPFIVFAFLFLFYCKSRSAANILREFRKVYSKANIFSSMNNADVVQTTFRFTTCLAPWSPLHEDQTLLYYPSLFSRPSQRNFPIPTTDTPQTGKKREVYTPTQTENHESEEHRVQHSVARWKSSTGLLFLGGVD
jgi:hypothetical protein